MFESKLFKALNTIDTEEWKPLRRYLAGIVGVENDITRLFGYIYASRRNLTNRRFKVENANEVLCPHLSRKSFQNIMSLLLHEIEAFWIWTDLRKDRQRWDLHRLEALNNRALYREADKTLAKISSTATDEGFLDLWNNYYLLRASHVVFFSNNPTRSRQPEGRNTLSKAVTTSIAFVSNLTSYYEAEIYNDMHVNHASWGEELALINPLRSVKDDSNLSKSLHAQTQLVKSRYSDDTDLLTKLVKDAHTNISPDLRLTFYYRLRRALIIKARAGNKEAILNLKEFIFWSIDSGLLIYNNQLYINRFIGDLNVLCALDENELAREYIMKFAPKLHPSIRQEGNILGEMIINFADNLHDDVITSYSYTTFKKVNNRLQAGGLFLRSSFAVYGADILYFESHIRNLSSFISRNKTQLSSFQIEGWKNFLKVFSMIIKKTKLEIIEQVMGQNQNMIHRKWIDDKMKSGMIS